MLYVCVLVCWCTLNTSSPAKNNYRDIISSKLVGGENSKESETDRLREREREIERKKEKERERKN